MQEIGKSLSKNDDTSPRSHVKSINGTDQRLTIMPKLIKMQRKGPRNPEEQKIANSFLNDEDFAIIKGAKKFKENEEVLQKFRQNIQEEFKKELGHQDWDMAVKEEKDYLWNLAKGKLTKEQKEKIPHIAPN